MLFRSRVLRVNPLSWTAWCNLGVIEMGRFKYDSASYFLQIAYALNFYNSLINLNLGICYFRLGMPDESEAYLLQSLKYDSTVIDGLLVLSDLYRDSRQEAKYVKTFGQIASHPDAPAKYVIGWIELLLREAKYSEASTKIGRASCRERV